MRKVACTDELGPYLEKVMNANEFKAQERAKNEAKFGRWASTLKIDAADPMKLFFEQAPRNELEAAQHGNALANTGNYPVGTSECFNVGISGGCGPDCFVYKKGQCTEPQEMLPGMDADGLKLHAELYGHNALGQEPCAAVCARSPAPEGYTSGTTEKE